MLKSADSISDFVQEMIPIHFSYLDRIFGVEKRDLKMTNLRLYLNALTCAHYFLNEKMTVGEVSSKVGRGVKHASLAFKSIFNLDSRKIKIFHSLQLLEDSITKRNFSNVDTFAKYCGIPSNTIYKKYFEFWLRGTAQIKKNKFERFKIAIIAPLILLFFKSNMTFDQISHILGCFVSGNHLLSWTRKVFKVDNPEIYFSNIQNISKFDEDWFLDNYGVLVKSRHYLNLYRNT